MGESVNGEERAMIVFDLNAAGDRIEGTYTLIAHAQFIEGASVAEPTAAMRENFGAVRTALAARDFASAPGFMALDAALYQYPPANLDNFRPIIAGAKDVASVLAFKWGEGVWSEEGAPRDDLFVAQFMQFVFVGIPGKGLDRVALFTFGADPAAPTYEKIVRVDVMGPSGG